MTQSASSGEEWARVQANDWVDRAFHAHQCPDISMSEYEALVAQELIAIVKKTRTEARREAIEECSKVAEYQAGIFSAHGGGMGEEPIAGNFKFASGAMQDLATKLRALAKEQP